MHAPKADQNHFVLSAIVQESLDMTLLELASGSSARIGQVAYHLDIIPRVELLNSSFLSSVRGRRDNPIHCETRLGHLKKERPAVCKLCLGPAIAPTIGNLKVGIFTLVVVYWWSARDGDFDALELFESVPERHVLGGRSRATRLASRLTFIIVSSSSSLSKRSLKAVHLSRLFEATHTGTSTRSWDKR